MITTNTITTAISTYHYHCHYYYHCEMCKQWQQALGLLVKMGSITLPPNVSIYSATIWACAKCVQWQQALGLLAEVRSIE